jgi:hypothetical protein
MTSHMGKKGLNILNRVHTLEQRLLMMTSLMTSPVRGRSRRWKEVTKVEGGHEGGRRSHGQRGVHVKAKKKVHIGNMHGQRGVHIWAKYVYLP